MTTTWGFAQEFLPKFQADCSDLALRIESASTAHSEFSAELARITKSLHDATGSLASYDQRQCEQTLKDLEIKLEALRLKTKPRSKFAFKRAPASLSSSQTEKPSAITQSSQIDECVPSSHLQLNSHKQCYLDWSALSSLSAGQSADLLLSDLDECIVNLACSPVGTLSAIHIRDVRNTILLLPFITGSALIHGTERCTIVLGCHQLRMHDSRLVDIYLDVSSTPVIEQTTDVQFTTYPVALLPQSQLGDSISNPNHQARPERSLLTFAVQDFSHIRPTPSPNWRMMGTPTVDHEWPMGRVDSSGLSEALSRILPRRTFT